MKKALYLYSPLPKQTNKQKTPNYYKNIRKIPNEGKSVQYLNNTFQTCQGKQKKGKSEKNVTAKRNLRIHDN